MSRNKDSNTQVKKSELEIRIEFKEYFGIDLNEADEMLKERRAETARAWNQVLVSHGVI